MITDIAFQRLDKLEYETALKDHFKKNKDYFKGQMDEAFETDENGDPLSLTPAQLEDVEDELIQLMHKKFLDGEDQYDYESVDQNEGFDDIKQMERDSEEKWFEEEDGENPKKVCTDTGILDY